MSITCLVPAAGKGTRMRPLTHTLPKAMLPVAGKPMIFHIIDQVASFGIENFVIVTGYLRELMEEELLSAYPNLKIKFAYQEKQLGLGHALYQAKELIPPSSGLLVVYGDTLFTADLKPVIQSSIPLIGVFEVADPRRFGIIEIDREGYITNFVEKPEKPLTNLTLPGVNFFPEAKPLFHALEILMRRDIKTRGEYQATDAYGLMVREMGIRMRYFKLNTWEDAGTLASLIETNAILLSRQGNILKGEIHNSQIHPPVFVSAGAKVEDSQIGPYVSLSSGTVVRQSQLKNFIADKESRIERCELQNSILGRQVEVVGAQGELVLGDHSYYRGVRHD
ncbi:MAG: sugar phosphate nucleotidyltransferase [Leptospiraceae bacterium]|nr:sugar phosphate nucleotidyltransferase [Leptospiraceae bacterium]MDW8306102.1 sugar phosphate nucleotidyltransferase [Leptospiraceae bacterium]